MPTVKSALFVYIWAYIVFERDLAAISSRSLVRIVSCLAAGHFCPSTHRIKGVLAMTLLYFYISGSTIFNVFFFEVGCDLSEVQLLFLATGVTFQALLFVARRMFSTFYHIHPFYTVLDF